MNRKDEDKVPKTTENEKTKTKNKRKPNPGVAKGSYFPWEGSKSFSLLYLLEY